MKNNTEVDTDIFLWANNLEAIKKDLNIELFLFNKNYTPYATDITDEMQQRLPILFLNDLLNEINLGAGTGLSVVDIAKSVDDENNILRHAKLDKVGRADMLLHIIENQRDDIVLFDELEHEFKRIKGIVARFTHPSFATFYSIKLIKQTESVSAGNCWQINDGVFGLMQPQVAFKIPADNQVMITNNDIFVFNQPKFATLFNYDARKLAEAEEKGAAIDKLFKLNMPTIGQGIAFMATQKNSLLNKLLSVDVGLITQEDVLKIADAMQIELMTSDNNGIILMDNKDVSVFLDILLDNFMQSDNTGIHYLVKNKKTLELADE